MTSARPVGPSAWRTRGQRGAVQIEFALTIITIIFVMFWIWELILLTYTMNVLGDAAKEGVRVAIVQGSSTAACPTAAVQTRVRTFAAMSFNDTSGMPAPTVRYLDPVAPFIPSVCSAPNRVRVEVTYQYKPFFNILPFAVVTLHSAAEGRIVFNPT